MIPKLRFPEFTDEWQEKKLEEVTNFRNGKAHEKDISESGKYIVINSKFISTNGKVRKYSDKQISPVNKNDIVMVMSDIPNGKAIAKCFMVDQEGRYTLNQRICALTAKTGLSHPGYLINTINRNPYYIKFDDGVKQTNLRRSDVTDLPLILPTVKEQQKIANFLIAVDVKINLLEQKKKGFEKYKKGVMQAIFSQKVRFRKAGGSSYPDWEEKRLGDTIQEVADGGTPSTARVEYFGGNISWVVIEDIKDRIYSTKQTLTEEGFRKCSAKLWPVGTVILSTGATIGEVGIAEVPVATKQGIVGIVTSDNILSRVFLKFWLQFNKPVLLRYAQGSSIKEIRSPELKRLKIDLPSKEEQEKIAAFLTSLDAKIVLINSDWGQAILFRKALLQQMFV